MHSKFAIHHVVEIPSPQSVDLTRQMIGQCFYVLIREDDGSRFRTADLQHGLIVSCRVEPHRDIFGILGSRKNTRLSKTLRVEKKLAFQIGASVDTLGRRTAVVTRC